MIVGVQWVRVGGARVLCWSAESQPSEEQLLLGVSAGTRIAAESLAHGLRRRELLASRYLSIHCTGMEPVSGNFGEPQWDDATIGSISHKQGHVALWTGAAAGGECGIDLELCRRLSEGVVDKVADESEQKLSHGLSFNGALLFSAKESIYKALFPVVRKKFWFDAVRLTDLCSNGDEAVLDFRLTTDLSSLAPEGLHLRAHASRIELDQSQYWLTCVRRAN